MAKKTTEIALISSDLQRSLDIIMSSKLEIDRIGENCLQIKVMDESTLSVAQQNLSKANEMAKFIESKRVEVKQPHLDNCKTIDATCKELSETILKGISHVKEELKQWELKRIERDRLEQEALEKKQKEEQEAIEADNRRKEDILGYLNETVVPWVKKQYDGLKSPEDCDKLTSTLNGKWPGYDKLQEYTEQSNMIRKNYLSLIEIKCQQLANAGNMSEEQKQLIKDKEQVIKDKEAIAERERLIAEKEASISAEKAKKEAEDKAKREQEELEAKQALNKTSNVRKTWKFELIDKTKLPEDWIILDDSKAKEYLASNKDSLKHGDVVNGVKFYQDVNISA